MSTRVGLERIWTVPNALSASRLFLLGGFAALLFSMNDRFGACVLLALAGITDFLDGYVARRFNQVTALGKLLDPTVDRIVVGTAVISSAVYGAIPTWLVVVVLFRELAVFGAAALLVSRHAEPVPVRWIGKAGTFGLMCTFPLFLLGDTSGTAAHATTDTAWVILVPSLICAFIAGFSYLPPALRSLAATRTASWGTRA